MIINLVEGRRLSSDKHQFTLEKRRMVKGEEIWTPYAYYGTLKHAVKGIPQQLLKESDAKGLTEVLLVLRQTERKLLQALGE